MNRRNALLSVLGFATVGLSVVGIASGGPPPPSAPPEVTVNAAPVNGITTFAPAHFTAAQLAGMPQTTETVTIDGTPTIETGPTLASVLSAAGLSYISACSNDELRYWILATGTGGAAAELTAGEIDPFYGNNVAILSLSENGQSFANPRLILPNDATDVRDIAGVNTITVGRAAQQLQAAGCPSTASTVSTPGTGEVVINGDVAHPMTLDYQQLEALPQVTQTDSYKSGSSTKTKTETGPTLFDVLSAAEPEFQFCNANDDARFYVEITSNEDGFADIVSWAEIDPASNGKQDLLSLTENGVALTPSGTGDTDPRSTAPFDVHGGRYNYGAAVITVFRVPSGPPWPPGPPGPTRCGPTPLAPPGPSR